MRMWMVNPKFMCRKHLLGEHVEIHMLAGSLTKGKSIQGFLDKGLIEVGLMQTRHDELVAEMTKRGYSHKSPLRIIEGGFKIGYVDKDKSLSDLIGRCKECRERFANSGSNSIMMEAIQ